MNQILPANIRRKRNLPPHQIQQHLYPRIGIGEPGLDGEITFRLTLGLPCCGVDLDVECPPTLTIAELGEISRAFLELRQKVRALPSFNVCAMPPTKAATASINRSTGQGSGQADR